jgi:3D-(3,5/4)-trihydroxycyclohexane-1,2-dione acylhydrolase (decyclizing)
MLNSEIVTAVAEGIRITVVIFDNHGYQCIKDLAASVGIAQFGNELRFRDPERNRLTGGYVPVDFKKHAESMGALAIYARTEDELRAALAMAREADRITVIHVAVSPEKRAPGYEGWWDVPPAAVSAREGVRTARERYETALGNQRRELL